MDQCCAIGLHDALPTLLPGEVHLWRSQLEVDEHALSNLIPLLSADECDRANRLRIPAKRQQFIVGRSHLRIILSRYVECDPRQLQFYYTRHGKPLLFADGHDQPWSFNLAHSQQLALLAIAAHTPIGVDIEAIRPIPLESLAHRFLQPSEVHWLSTLAAEHRQAAFFRLWTCKEAYLKATGEGLAGLKHIQVGWKSGSARLQDQQNQPQPYWSLHELRVADGFAAALVVKGQPHAIRWFEAKSPLIP